MKINRERKETQIHRIDSPLESIFTTLAPCPAIFIQAANTLATVCKIDHPGQIVGSLENDLVFLPDCGLQLSPAAIEQIHYIRVQTSGVFIPSIEFALSGDPCALIFAAPSTRTDTIGFEMCVSRLRMQEIDSYQYENWCRQYRKEVKLCPCCADRANQYRANPALHPLTAVLKHCLQEKTPLRCALCGKNLGFSVSLTLGEIDLNNGRVHATGMDETSHLSVDPGICYSMAVDTVKLDDEVHSRLRLFDQLGSKSLEITTPGYIAAAAWRRITIPEVK